MDFLNKLPEVDREGQEHLDILCGLEKVVKAKLDQLEHNCKEKCNCRKKIYVKARGVFGNPWQEVILKQAFEVSKFMYFYL